ncbi:extracellular solute-binding protein [Cryobacterium tepidiphilum]|uniref:Extracellular solute-binding protein n=2 Tax=Cryobacterium tepidiphilum TaxID=2486026 RepID=A0A3M8LA65_9MICO|nr:extracellular solute-binding protein [Cryobacterium tepidiphilum]
MKKKAMIAIFTISATVAMLTGCSSGGATKSDDSFSTKAQGAMTAWGFNNTDDVGKARLAHAEKAIPDVTITMDQTAFDAQKFTTRVASGNVPDVVQMDANFVATYAAQGLIMPLDACYSAHKVDGKERYYESVIDAVSYNDHVWAVPQFYQPPAIILNKRVMDAAGVTNADINTSKPDALIAAAKKMYQANGGIPTRLGFDPVATGQTELWILGNGGQLIDDSGKPTLDNPDNQKGLQLLKDIYDAQGGYAKAKSFSDTFDTFGKDNQFVKDQVGAQVDNQWYVNVLTPYVDGVEIDAVPFYGADGQPFTVAGGSAFVIPAGAKNKDAACAWALDLTSLDSWKAAGAARADTVSKTPGAVFTGLFTGSPEADKVIRETYVKPSGNEGFDKTIATFYDIVSHGKSIGTSPVGQQVKSELQNALQAVLLGSKTPEKALADAQDQVMRAYDKAQKDNGK